MTPFVSLRTSASLALGAAVIAAGTLLAGAPVAGADPSTETVKAIDDRYTAFGGEGSLLGAPTGVAVDVPGGAERDYSGGAIYYSKDTGAHVMYGDILERYRALGGPTSELGFPRNDESDTGDGVGRFNDFTTPGGASIYWTPQWGASVVKGRVLEAWRQSGGITGPFGYPSADTSIADGVQTGKFVGPEGSEIQWSEAGGLVTVPPELAGKMPGFGTPPPVATTTAEGTTSVSTPGRTESEAPAKSTKSSKWWWIPVGIGILALLGLLSRLLLRKRPEPEPVRVATRAPEVRRPAPAPVKKTVPPAPRPVVKAPAPPVVKAPPPAPKPPVPPAPPRIAPVVKAPEPPAPKPFVPPAPKPVVPPAPKPVVAAAPPKPPVVAAVPPKPPVVAVVPPKPPVVVPEPPKVVRTEVVHTEVVHTEVEVPKVVHTEVEIPETTIVHTEPVTVHTEPVIHTESVIHSTSVEHDVAPLIRYESHTPTETTIQVTYENNALGDHQESVADKSDATPD